MARLSVHWYLEEVSLHFATWRDLEDLSLVLLLLIIAGFVILGGRRCGRWAYLSTTGDAP